MGLGIKTFEIKGLFNRFNVKLPLDNDVNIFLGENGLGKTTILNCFCYALKCDFKKLSNISFQKIIFTFNDNQNLELNYDDLNNYIEIKEDKFIENILFEPKFKSIIQDSFYKNDIETIDYCIRRLSRLADIPIIQAKKIIYKYMNNDYNDKIKTENIKDFEEVIRQKINNTILHFPTYRRIEEDMNNLGINMTRTYRYYEDNELIQFGMKDVKNKIKELLEKIKSKSISSFRKMTARLITQYLDELNSDNKILDHISKDQFKIDTNKLDIALARIGTEIESKDKDKIKKLVSDGKIYDNNVYLLNLIKNLIDSYNEQKVYDEKIKGFVDICNKYLRGKQFVYNESTVELNIITDDRSIIEMENLSSGEKQIVSTFSKLYIIEEINDCVVIFDEPELSLSISWQENFLPDVMNSPKCKFILAATHSPFIFSNEFRQLANDMSECVSPMDKENL